MINHINLMIYSFFLVQGGHLLDQGMEQLLAWLIIWSGAANMYQDLISVIGLSVCDHSD